MSLIKRERFWHYDFIYKGKRFQGSTDQTNKNIAKLVEAKVRSDAALELFGIAPPKRSPMFKEFMDPRFLDHVRQHNKEKPATVGFYEEKVRRLLEYEPFAKARISDIDEDMIAEFCAWRAQQKRRKRNDDKLIGPGTVNLELATLRKALNLAYEWRLIPRVPKIRKLPGAKGREFILTGDMEKHYLAAVDYPLRQVAILMLDFGLRTEECVRIKKADITDASLTVWSGKSANARRALPQTTRSKQAIELLSKLFPDSPWLFPGRIKGAHLTRSAVDNMHALARDKEDSGIPKEFVLYCLRHTFGSRLAESGASPFHITTLMGHSDIRVSQKYIHPGSEDIERAMKRKEVFDKMLRGEADEIEGVPAIIGGTTIEKR